MVCGCSIHVWCTMLTLEDLLVVYVRVSCVSVSVFVFVFVCLCVCVCFWVFVKRKSQEQFLSNFLCREIHQKKLFVSKKLCITKKFLCPKKLCDLRNQSCSTKGHYSAVFESNDCPGADAPEQLTSVVSVDVTKS